MHIHRNTALLAGALAATLAAGSSQAAITHRYSFTSDGSDSVGGATATLMNGAYISGGTLNMSSFSGTAQLPSSDATGQYAKLPGNVLSGLSSATIEFWGYYGDSAGNPAGTWSRVFDFGNSVNGSGANYIFFTPHSGVNNNAGDSRSGFKINDTERNATYGAKIDDGNMHHVACVFDAAGGFIELYVDGAQTGRDTCSLQLSGLATNNMWLGRSQWGGDEYLYGSIDEFRIHNRALSGAEVAADFAAGANTPDPTIAQTLGTISTIYLPDPGSIVEKTSTNIVVKADFANASGVQLFNLPNFTLTSSDPTVATISAAGVIKALKPGNTTLSASYGGTTVTQPFTVLADTVAPVITGVNPMGYDRFLQVTFSKPLDPVSAQNPANYVIDGGAIAVSKAALNTNDNMTVRLIFASKASASSFHTLVVQNVKDTDHTPNVIPANSTSFFPSAGSPLQRRLYYSKNGYNTDAKPVNADGTVSGFYITSNPDFPHGGNAVVEQLSNGLTSGGGLGDGYVAVIDGYILPPTTGDYVFYPATDDDSAFYVSTDGTEANLPSVYTSSQVGWSGTKSYSGATGAGGGYKVVRNPVTLTAGNKYYFRSIHRNGSGGDNFDIGWQLPGGAAPADGSAAIGASVLADPAYTPVAMTISGVGDQTTYQNKDLTFTATVSAKPAYIGLQWYRNGTAISNATGLSYTLTLPQKSVDDGATYYLVASNLVDVVTSAVAHVTVIVDNNAPTLVSAAGASGNQVVVTFSERLDTTTATKASNYGIQGLTVTRADFADATKTVVLLTTTAQTPGNNYTVVVNGVKDLAGNAMSNASINFIALARLDGFTSLHWWPFSGNYNNNTDADHIYAYSLTNTPSGSWLVTTHIGTPHALNGWSEGMDYYCDVAEGYIVAPETGTYTIRVTSDDRSRIWLSTNETVSGLSTNPAAWVNDGWTGGAGDWGSGNAHWTSVNLVAGTRYFYRLVHQDGWGGDGCLVGWELPSNPGTVVAIPPANFGTYYNPSLSVLTITNQPVGASMQATRQASFTVVAGGSSSLGGTVTYQWMKNGVAIDGATRFVYTTPLLNLADDGAVYTCVITVPGKTITTDPATVHVVDTAPVIESAGAFADSQSVGIRFNKLVDPASAVAATYTIAGNNVSSVQFRTNASLDAVNGDMVVLTLDNPIVEGSLVTVENITDINGHTTASTTAPIGLVSGMSTADLGTPGTDPLYVGSTVPTSTNSFQILAGGTDIWETHDGAHFAYKMITGDFDVRMRVADLQNQSTWSKAGLMVRETLDANSRDLNIVVDPSTGANAWECNYRNVTGGASAGWPQQHANDLAPTYPHAWVRLTGIGNVYTAYRSWDGINWTQLGRLDYSTAAYANQYVGIAVTAHNNNASIYTIADIYDFALTEIVSTPPTLSASFDGANIVITWDTALGTGFSVVGSADVTAPAASWSAVDAQITTDGTKTKATIPAPTGPQFYRLKK